MSELTDTCVDCGKCFDEVDICCDKGTGNSNMHIEGHCTNCCTEHLSQDEKTIAALRARVAELEAALYPFQHPDFTSIKYSDNKPMWSYCDSVLDYGDFRRARELFTQPTSRPEPTTTARIIPTHHIGAPALSKYAAAMTALIRDGDTWQAPSFGVSLDGNLVMVDVGQGDPLSIADARDLIQALAQAVQVAELVLVLDGDNVIK